MIEPDPPTPMDWTPSDVVLLACDRFAPIPTAGRGWWTRFEAGFGATNLPDGTVTPFLTDRQALGEPLVIAMLSAALLANERAGVLRLELRPADFPSFLRDLFTGQASGRLRLHAVPLGAAAPWPADSLEDRIRRDRPDTVTSLVAGWLVEKSYAPHERALRLAEQGLVYRGLALRHRLGAESRAVLNEDSSAAAAVINVEPVLGLLQSCRQQRPDIWHALQRSIRRGLANRKMEPGQRQVGRTYVPVYDYIEPPVWELDAVEPMPMASDRASDPAPSDAPSDATPAPPPRETPAWGQLILSALLAGGAAIRLSYSDGPPWVPVAGLVIGVVVTLSTAWFAASARRQLRAGLPTAGQPGLGTTSAEWAAQLTRASQTVWWNHLLSGALAGTFFALIGAFGPFWLGTALVLTGLLLGYLRRKMRRPKAREVAAAVEARLQALVSEPAVAAAGGLELAPLSPLAPDAAGRPALSLSPHRNIPMHLMGADDLPAPAGAQGELLERPAQREKALFRQAWWALAALMAGLSLIGLAFSASGDGRSVVLPGLGAAWAFTALLFAMALCSLWPVASFGPGDFPRPHLAMTLWRLGALLCISALLGGTLRQQAFALALIFFLAGHWLWRQRALARIGQRHPVPEPLRLVLLRVFGSPSFDDLIPLIEPWRRVGVIEHLEGFDSIGKRLDAQEALLGGHIDDMLAKSSAEVARNLAALSLEPDAKLLFRRHAFQCTDATWRLAICTMLDRGDAVLMDLSSLAPDNQGCAWELGQLLDRVPLARVTLLVNNSTDLDCLQQILDAAARRIAADSPNRDDDQARWRLVRIGGLSQRGAHESHFEWRRRIDHRLDPLLLAGQLLSTALPARSGEVRSGPAASAKAPPWARQALLPWALLFALLAALPFLVRLIKVMRNP